MIRFLNGSRRAGATAVALVALVALAGCGSGKSSSSTATTTSGGSTTTAAGGGGGDQSAELSAIASSVKAGKQATFKAGYTYQGSSSGTVTIEQKPPKSLFSTGDGEVISTGTTTYYCSTSGATPTCLSTGTSNPLAALSQLFAPDSAVNAIQAAEAQVAAHAQGYDVSFSDQSFAGQASKCVTLSGSGQSGKYCVTTGGILAYSGSASNSFTLTSYSGKVSDSDFALPAGASTVTLPPGVSIPGATP